MISWSEQQREILDALQRDDAAALVRAEIKRREKQAVPVESLDAVDVEVPITVSYGPGLGLLTYPALGLDVGQARSGSLTVTDPGGKFSDEIRGLAEMYGITIASNPTPPRTAIFPDGVAFDEVVFDEYDVFTNPQKDSRMLQVPDTANPYRPESSATLGRATDSPSPSRPDGTLERADEVDTLGISLQDLDRLVQWKVQRARRDGDDAAYLRESALRVKACAQAFDEGWRDAYGRGVEEMRSAVYESAGRNAAGMTDAAKALVRRDPKSVTKAEMLEFIAEVAKTGEHIHAQICSAKTERR